MGLRRRAHGERRWAHAGGECACLGQHYNLNKNKNKAACNEGRRMASVAADMKVSIPNMHTCPSTYLNLLCGQQCWPHRARARTPRTKAGAAPAQLSVGVAWVAVQGRARCSRVSRTGSYHNQTPGSARRAQKLMRTSRAGPARHLSPRVHAKRGPTKSILVWRLVALLQPAFQGHSAMGFNDLRCAYEGYLTRAGPFDY